MNSTPAPTLTKRCHDLGWMASPPRDYPLRFAVTAPTEAEALERFAEALERWEATPDD